MAYQFSVDDVRFLTSSTGFEALQSAAALPLTEATLLADLTTLRKQLRDRAAPVAETVRLRRRAIGKLGPAAAGWLFTDEALQQATPATGRRAPGLPVGRYRGARPDLLDRRRPRCAAGSG